MASVTSIVVAGSSPGREVRHDLQDRVVFAGADAGGPAGISRSVVVVADLLLVVAFLVAFMHARDVRGRVRLHLRLADPDGHGCMLPSSRRGAACSRARPAKNSPTAGQTSRPPDRPFQCWRMTATSR